MDETEEWWIAIDFEKTNKPAQVKHAKEEARGIMMFPIKNTPVTAKSVPHRVNKMTSAQRAQFFPLYKNQQRKEGITKNQIVSRSGFGYNTKNEQTKRIAAIIEMTICLRNVCKTPATAGVEG